jgi:hypothetical protein
MKRRKFIALTGSVTVGGLSIQGNNAVGADINVNSDGNDISLEAGNIGSLIISFYQIQITSSNINPEENFNLTISGFIDGEDIGTIKSYSIETSNSSQTDLGPLQLDVTEGEKYDPQLLKADQDLIDVQIIFQINHPDIQKVKQSVQFVVNFTSGSVKSYSGFGTAENYDLKENNNIIDISSSDDLSVWDIEDKDQKLIRLLGEGSYNHKSSYSIPKGFIDLNERKFGVSPRNTGEKELESAEIENIQSNSDLSVWSVSDRIEKLKRLLGEGAYTHKASYAIPKGFIDLNQRKFGVSPRNTGESSLSTPSKSKYKIQ